MVASSLISMVFWATKNNCVENPGVLRVLSVMARKVNGYNPARQCRER